MDNDREYVLDIFIAFMIGMITHGLIDFILHG